MRLRSVINIYLTIFLVANHDTIPEITSIPTISTIPKLAPVTVARMRDSKDASAIVITMNKNAESRILTGDSQFK